MQTCPLVIGPLVRKYAHKTYVPTSYDRQTDSVARFHRMSAKWERRRTAEMLILNFAHTKCPTYFRIGLVLHDLSSESLGHDLMTKADANHTDQGVHCDQVHQVFAQHIHPEHGFVRAGVGCRSAFFFGRIDIRVPVTTTASHRPSSSWLTSGNSPSVTLNERMYSEILGCHSCRGIVANASVKTWRNMLSYDPNLSTVDCEGFPQSKTAIEIVFLISPVLPCTG